MANSLLAVVFAAALCAPAAADEPAFTPPELLRFEQAAYPPEALTEGLEADVLLAIDVLPDGSVGAVEVLEPVGFGFDEAAAEAARRFRFRPARSGGATVPARIQFRYGFTIEERHAPPPPQGVVRGVVRERGTGAPLAGVTVTAPDAGAHALTGPDGRFVLDGLAPGPVRVVVPPSEWREAEASAEASPEGADVELLLERDPYASFRTLITAEERTAQGAHRQLSVQEIQRLPGTSGDALRAIQSLPGLARPTVGSGLLVVRGSAPEDTAFRVDDLPIPQLYHFVGVTSVLNTDLVEAIDFLPGGFSVRHGNATAGLVDVRLKPGRRDRWGGYADLNIFHVSALASGPVAEDASLTLAARRSWIDAILPAIVGDDSSLRFTTAPVYWDYQLLFDADLGRDDALRVLVYGSDDQTRLFLSEPAGDNPGVRGDVRSHLLFHVAQARWEHRLRRGLSVVTSLQGGYQGYNGEVGPAIDFDVRIGRLALREELAATLGPVELRLGLDTLLDAYHATIHAIRPPREGGTIPPIGTVDRGATDEEGLLWRGGLYAEVTARPIEALTLTAGARIDAHAGIFEAATVDPRAGLRWDAVDGTALKASLGLYHRRPDDDELYRFFGATGLVPERALQVGAGVEQRIWEGLSIEVQGFYKDLRDLVAASQDPTSPEPLVSAGEGRVYGGEVLLRQAAGGFLWGWVAYTLSKSERRDGPGLPLRPFDFDQTHVLTAVVSAELPWDLTLGLRYRYATGNPVTPITGAVFDADVGLYQGIRGPVNSDRLPDFHQLDVRLDKRWIFDDWVLVTYLEAQNATNRANPEDLAWQYDYRRSAVVTGLPILPGFGIRGEL